MKTRSFNANGFGHVALVFVVLFLAVVGFAGYKVVTANRSVATTPPAKTAATAVPAAINSKADLVQISKVLDSSSAQVDSSLNDNALNSDLNDML